MLNYCTHLPNLFHEFYFRYSMYFMYAYTTFIFLTLVHFYGNVSGMSGAFYADNGSGQSVLYRTLAKNDRVELQKEILKLLDLKQRPKRSLSTKQGRNYFRESSSKKYLLRLYRAVGDSKARKKFCRKNKACMELLTGSDFIISYSNKIDEFSPFERKSSNRFFFDVSNINSDWAVVRAELRIFRNVTERSEVHQGKKFLVSLYALLDDEHNSEKLELVEDFIISNESSRRWFTFNVTTVLKKWNKFPFSNYGLILKVKPSTVTHEYGYEISPYDFGITTDGSNEFKAFMVAYFKSSSQQRLRAKRAPRRKHFSSCSKGSHNPYRSPALRYVPKARSCEKWTLYVNFRDLGFDDWIIAPDGYGAFYCDGSCMFPLNAQMNATNHAIVQTLMHLMDPSGVPKPSCAPTQLSSITVLYFDDNSNVILKRYKNMVVKSCGCH